MSPREEYHTVRLPKGWTPARIQRFADSVARLNMATHLAIENAALRRERRALRKLLKRAMPYLAMVAGEHLRADILKALKPRKARRRTK